MPIKATHKKRYPVYWTLLSKFIRFVRAQSRCECSGQCGDHHIGGRCEERHGEQAHSFGGTVRLAAAHLDHRPENDDSVVALCQRCHLQHDRPHHIAERRKSRLLERARYGIQLCFALVTPAFRRLKGTQLDLFTAANDDTLPLAA